MLRYGALAQLPSQSVLHVYFFYAVVVFPMALAYFIPVYVQRRIAIRLNASARPLSSTVMPALVATMIFGAGSLWNFHVYPWARILRMILTVASRLGLAWMFRESGVDVSLSPSRILKCSRAGAFNCLVGLLAMSFVERACSEITPLTKTFPMISRND